MLFEVFGNKQTKKQTTTTTTSKKQNNNNNKNNRIKDDGFYTFYDIKMSSCWCPQNITRCTIAAPRLYCHSLLTLRFTEIWEWGYRLSPITLQKAKWEKD